VKQHISTMLTATRNHHVKLEEKKQKRDKLRNSKSAWYEFLEGLIIYALCISLPALVGLGVTFTRNHMGVTREGVAEIRQDTNSITNEYSFLPRSSTTSTRYYYYKATSLTCHHNSPFRDSDFCTVRKTEPTQNVANSTGVLGSSSIKINVKLTDLQFVIVLSFSLAIFRIMLVHFLVPRYLAPRRLAALVRCKSSHLLRSSSTGCFASLQELASSSISSSSSSRAVTSDANNNPDDSCNSMKKVWRSFRFSIRRSLGHEASAPYNQLADSEKQLMFSSPRYATAMFRLLYSLSSSIAAWFMFHNAGFWPLYLGGKKTGSHHSLLGLIRKRPDGIGWGL